MVFIMDYNRFEAFIFDLDGTLIDSMPLHEKAWQATLNHFNLPIFPDLMRDLLGVPTRESLIAIAKQANCRLADVDSACAFKHARFKELLEQGINTTPVADLAKDYRGRKPMAVGTGAMTQEALDLLELAGLRELFTVVIGADQVRYPKPAPDTFALAADRLGVKADKCIVFEDGEPGLIAARACGMYALDIRKEFATKGDYFHFYPKTGKQKNR